MDGGGDAGAGAGRADLLRPRTVARRAAERLGDLDRRGGIADARGAVEVATPIPNVPALRGLLLHAQAIALDPNGAFVSLLSFSAGLRIRLD